MRKQILHDAVSTCTDCFESLELRSEWCMRSASQRQERAASQAGAASRTETSRHASTGCYAVTMAPEAHERRRVLFEGLPLEEGSARRAEMPDWRSSSSTRAMSSFSGTPLDGFSHTRSLPLLEAGAEAAPTHSSCCATEAAVSARWLWSSSSVTSTVGSAVPAERTEP